MRRYPHLPDENVVTKNREFHRSLFRPDGFASNTDGDRVQARSCDMQDAKTDLVTLFV